MSTIDDGTYRAVLDRFEGDLAVLLVEDGSEVVGEMIVETDELPEAGRHADAVFTVEVADGDPTGMTYEGDETTDRKEQAQRRFDRLSRRPPGDGEDKDDG